MSGNKVHDKKKKAAKPRKCNAKRKSDGGKCQRPAGWGTDHPGKGRCKLHGGASTGPKSLEGKQRITLNAIKHGGYVDKLLNEEENELYEILYEGTVEKHNLDKDDPIVLSTLQRACITWIKLIRLDQWQLKTEVIPVNEPRKHKETGEVYLKERPIFGEDGAIQGHEYVTIDRIRIANVPNWESHFRKYMQLLGVDRQTRIRQDGLNKVTAAVEDGMSWLWGGKSKEGTG